MPDIRHKQCRDMYHFTVPLPVVDDDTPADTHDEGIYKMEAIGNGCFHSTVDYSKLDQQ